MTTAIYPNRQADKAKVEAAFPWLREDGTDHPLIFMAKGGEIFARSYVRVVYGDHGPYVEFEPDDVIMVLKPKWDRPLPAHCFYQWLIPAKGPEMKIYDQRKAVHHLPNPPAGGFRGNRPVGEGYADYKVGMLYVSPWEFEDIVLPAR